MGKNLTATICEIKECEELCYYENKKCNKCEDEGLDLVVADDRMYEVAWKMLYDNAREEERETRTRTWKEIMELVRSDVKEMVAKRDNDFDWWVKYTIGGFE